MKNIHILKGVFIAFLAVQFFACENEPLEGDFPPREEEQTDSLQVKFEAMIDGEKFIASSVDAKISEDNYLILSGEKSTGEKILLKVPDISTGTFRLSGGEDDADSGLYYRSSNRKPYTTDAEFGGLGEVKIDSIDGNFRRLSGKFEIEGVRPELDNMGNPVLDENGDPIIESVSIKEGVFRNIAFEIGGAGSGSGSGGNQNHDFFAKVDGEAFNSARTRISDTLIAGTRMIRIHAKNQNKDHIRIDVPLYLSEGTHEMESISNGTLLVGSYKTNEGELLTSNPGTLIISEFDKERGILKATFEFTATDPLGISSELAEITEGKMTIRFEGIPGGNNSFSAKVDGRDYLPSSVVVDVTTVGQLDRYVVETEMNDQTLILSFPKSVREGNTYRMIAEVVAGNEVNGTYSPDGEGYFTSGTGEMTITLLDENNRILEGIFEFEAVDPSGNDPTEYIIEEGIFSVTLP